VVERSWFINRVLTETIFFIHNNPYKLVESAKPDRIPPPSLRFSCFYLFTSFQTFSRTFSAPYPELSSGTLHWPSGPLNFRDQTGLALNYSISFAKRNEDIFEKDFRKYFVPQNVPASLRLGQGPFNPLIRQSSAVSSFSLPRNSRIPIRYF